MGRRIDECDLWSEPGQGAVSGNTWNDVLSLGRRADGTYRLRLRRQPNDCYRFADRVDGPVTLYCSTAFRKADRLLEMLLDAPPPDMDVYGAWPNLGLPTVLLILANVFAFDASFGREVLRALALRLERVERNAN